MAEWVQMDLLDLIAEAEKSERDELCKGWKNAVKSDCGCFSHNTHFYPAGKMSRFYMSLKLALAFPYVYGNVDYSTPVYGIGSPLDEDSYIKFSVYDELEDIRHELLKQINRKINNDGNLTPKDCTELYRLTDNVVAKAIEDLQQ